MRDPKRIDRILNLIKGKWMETPDQRFGQFLINYLDPFINFFVEDDQLEDFMRNQRWVDVAVLDEPTWTSVLDAQGELLDVPVTRLISNLADDHIVSIIKYMFSANRLPMDVVREAARRKLLHLVLPNGGQPENG